MRPLFPVLILGFCLTDGVAAQPAAVKVARQLDASLSDELFTDETQIAPRSTDVVFHRRIWLDLVGDIPTPEETIAFVLDPAPDKRSRLIEELIDHPAYGQNWARYWRDVIFFHALDNRSSVAIATLEAELTRQFNENKPWDQIAAQFITTRGDVKQDGSTAIMMAQDARTEETAAEVSRVFLGIQIQCAQCHDHPYDRWNRQQFHELAAFFPRVGVRGVNEVTQRSFEIFANDSASRRSRPNNGNRPLAEHFMPNLENPSEPGEKMQPKFFLTGAEVPLGTKDADRRQQLANWLTSDRWFSTALVNRMWMELVGEGFYEPVDDIGPDRKPTAPATVELLSKKFRKSGYDLKWLVKTICQTEAYQRETRPRRGLDETPFAANVPQPLRSDQLLNAAYTASGNYERPTKGSSKLNRAFGIRRRFAELFGYDPSVAREDVGSSIPQALALMNSPELDQLLRSRDKNSLNSLLKEIKDDELLILELYLRWLCRQPTDEELATALDYCQNTKDRRAAFEDLQWSLFNSAEFRHRP